MATDSDALHRAKTLFDHGMLREALRVAQAGLDKQPNDGRLWDLVGLIQHARGEFNTACRAIETASLLVPLTPPVQCVLAETYLQSEQGELARLIYEHLAKLSDLPVYLLSKIASGLGRVGEIHLALQVCRRAAGRQPECDAPLFAMAYYMGRLRYPLEVILPVLDRAISLAPDCVLYRVSKAMLLERHGRTAEAVSVVRAVPVAELASLRCGRCLARLCQLFLGAGDTERAAACRQALDEMQPPSQTSQKVREN
jgi:tetratricopeptide (TPR) repeat protein